MKAYILGSAGQVASMKGVCLELLCRNITCKISDISLGDQHLMTNAACIP